MKKFSYFTKVRKFLFYPGVLAVFRQNQRAHPSVAIETLQTVRKSRNVTELKIQEIKFRAFAAEHFFLLM